MKIITLKELRELFRDRHNRRGYYDFVKTSLGILVSILVLIIFLYDILERFELTTFDYRMRFRSKRAVNDKIVLVDMGEDSVKKIGRWPWPREWHATIISVLSQFGAEAVVFDVLFSEKSSEFSDSAMEEAMRKTGNVYIPYAVELDRYDEYKKGWNVWDIILPLDELSRQARGEGHITIVPDPDGIIRRIPLIVEYEDKVYHQLGLKVACDDMGIDSTKYKIIRTPFSRYLRVGGDKKKVIYIPVDGKNQILVNWAARWGRAFKHYSYIDVVTSYQRMLAGKDPLINLGVFKDKICIIGLTAAGLYDIKPSPLHPSYPAVGTNANIINSILNRDFIRKAPRWLDGFIIIILGVFLSVSVTRVKPMRGASIALLMIITYALISFAVLDVMKTWISAFYPLIAIIFAYLVITFYNQIVIAIERAKLYTLATKDGLTGLFVVRHFSLLLEAEVNRLESSRGRLSILMSDIDHFKKVNDTYGHQVGDFILREIASILMSCCRQLDVPSRYGGEEFIVMLPGADINDAATVAERIRSSVERHHFKIGDSTYRVTISLGVATYEKGDTKNGLINKADSALYEAKTEGRNKVCLVRPEQK